MEFAAPMEVTISGSNKRKRLLSGDAALLLQHSRHDSHANYCPVCDAKLLENSVSLTKMCEDLDEVPANSLGSLNEFTKKCPTRLDLKDDEISLTSHGRFSSSSNTEEPMESSETKRKKAKFSASLAAVAMMPSKEEIEEFLSAAEKREQERFTEKYNYDVVKDVPLEGRYQWVCLKP